jgi:DNA-binding MarR family transcriptional regulator
MLSKLEAKGLIYKEKDPNNGKQQLLYVTPKGKHLSLCHKAYDETTVPIQEITERFGAEAIETYIGIVEYMVQHYMERKNK